MKRKIRNYKKIVMSISAIGILYFAVVNVIGDTIGLFVDAPQYDTAQDPGDSGQSPGELLDRVRNAALVTAVLFPDGTWQRPEPPQVPVPDSSFADFAFIDSFSDAGNTQYIASTNNGSNLFGSLDPQSIDPQHFTPLARNPNHFGGNRGISGLPGVGRPPLANRSEQSPGTNAGGAESLPSPQTDSNKDFVPVQIAASHVPDNNFDGNSDDTVDGNDVPPGGVSQSNLLARTPSPVPEPASLLLMLLAVGTSLQLRRPDAVCSTVAVAMRASA